MKTLTLMALAVACCALSLPTASAAPAMPQVAPLPLTQVVTQDDLAIRARDLAR